MGGDVYLASLEPLGPILAHCGPLVPSWNHLNPIMALPGSPGMRQTIDFPLFVYYVFEMPPLGYMFYDRGLF